jgi:hypothetical protein
MSCEFDPLEMRNRFSIVGPLKKIGRRERINMFNSHLTQRLYQFTIRGALLFAATISLQASPLAYAITTTGQFGNVDLGTGIFTDIDPSEGIALAGLGVADGNLYTETYANFNPTLDLINPLTGGLTEVGNGGSAVELFAFGSTTSGLYALGGNTTDFTLYLIDSSTGVATAIGLTGLGNGGAFSLSTNSSILFFTQGSNSTLYTISTSTAASTAVGSLGGGEQMGAMVFIGGTLYGNDAQPLFNAISTINTTSGAATLGPNVTGAGGTLGGLAPDPLSAAASPEPSTWLFLSFGLSGLALLRLRSGRTSS